MEVTAQMQYDGGYPVNSIDALKGDIIVRRATSCTYGYELYNKRLGKRFFWYRYKRDAVLKIEEIKRYNQE